MSNFSQLLCILDNTGANSFAFAPLNGDNLFTITFNTQNDANLFFVGYNSQGNNIVRINGITITTGSAVIHPDHSNVVIIIGTLTQIGLISAYINIAERRFIHPIVFGPFGLFGSINVSNIGLETGGTVLGNFVTIVGYGIGVNIKDTGDSESVFDAANGSVTALGAPLTLFCLLKGTKILTPAGEILVENLKINDTVLTADGREVKIMDIHSTLASSQDNLYVIHKDTISSRVPNEDLFVSGGHLVKIHDKCYHPFHNKTNLIEKCSDNKLVQFYHVKLENYLTDFLVANGVEVESLGDIENPEHTTWDCSGEECKLLINKETV
jgi:hypothetical protein